MTKLFRACYSARCRCEPRRAQHRASRCGASCLVAASFPTSRRVNADETSSCLPHEEEIQSSAPTPPQRSFRGLLRAPSASDFSLNVIPNRPSASPRSDYAARRCPRNDVRQIGTLQHCSCGQARCAQYGSARWWLCYPSSIQH
jgi:hypothetical protein